MPSEDKGPVRVHLYVDTGFAGASHEDDIEFDRAEWDAMSPARRREALDAEADTLMANHIEYGWQIKDDEDYASTEGGAE